MLIPNFMVEFHGSFRGPKLGVFGHWEFLVLIQYYIQHFGINPYKPSVLFVGRRQIV